MHYHTSYQGTQKDTRVIDRTVAFSRFGHCLSRCAVLMMGDDQIRKPFECDSLLCIEQVVPGGYLYKVKGLVHG